MSEAGEFLLSRGQIKAGRALAGIGVRTLAAAAGVSPTAVSFIETGRTSHARAATLRALRLALEGFDIEFANDGWVRRRAGERDRDVQTDEAEAPTRGPAPDTQFASLFRAAHPTVRRVVVTLLEQLQPPEPSG